MKKVKILKGKYAGRTAKVKTETTQENGTAKMYELTIDGAIIWNGNSVWFPESFVRVIEPEGRNDAKKLEHYQRFAAWTNEGEIYVLTQCDADSAVYVAESTMDRGAKAFKRGGIPRVGETWTMEAKGGEFETVTIIKDI